MFHFVICLLCLISKQFFLVLDKIDDSYYHIEIFFCHTKFILRSLSLSSSKSIKIRDVHILLRIKCISLA